MQDFFYKVFRYIPRETEIKLYGLSHCIYILTTLIIIVALCLLFRNKSEKAKQTVLNVAAVAVIFVYVFDFFVQPFWDGEMVVGKLPFHICTAVGVLIPFVNFSKKFNFMKTTITVWAVLAPLAFIFAPMNYINRAVEPYSYPIIQTFLFHALEVFWGVFMLVSGKVQLKWKTIWQPIVGLFPMALWAAFGQEIYYGADLGENFLFLRTDISAIAPQWLLLPGLFIGASLAISILYLIYFIIQKLKRKKQV